MSSTDLQRLMQTVLDGEATPEESAELERHLVASAGARAEFDQQKQLFDALKGVPTKFPPEGLVASVMAALPVIPQARQNDSQLSAASRVLPAQEGILIQGDRPVEQQHQPLPPQRSLPMTQPHPPYSAKRKAWIGAGIALVAVAIVVRFGFDSVPKAEDVAGTVVPAQRYRAPQAAPDIQLGDQSLAQLMQNDAFVKLIRDPQIQAMAREPGFVEAAQLLRNHPEAARLMLVHAESGKQVLAAPELAKTMAANADAVQAFERIAASAAALQASPQAQKLLAEHSELARYVSFLAPLERKSGEGQKDFLRAPSAQMKLEQQAQQVAANRVLAWNAEQAQRIAERAIAADKKINWGALEKAAAEHAALERFMLANQDLARVVSGYVDAARALNASPEAAQLVAKNAEAAKIMMFNPELARAAAQSPEAMRALLAYPEATRAMLAAPDASRALLQNPEAARLALQAAAAEHSADRAQKADRAAERAQTERANK